MRKENERPMRVTVTNEPHLTSIEKLAICMGVPLNRAIQEAIRRMKLMKGAEA